MTKPNYEYLLGLIATETDPNVKASLIAQAYQFPEPLTEEEKSLFDYVQSDFIENNPGYIESIFSSYIGKYYSEDGELSQ